VEFDEILASPLRRAMRTAQLATGRTARPEPRARERDFGRYDGLTLQDIRVEVPGWHGI
jgi:probable phosphoglycerate mutase